MSVKLSHFRRLEFAEEDGGRHGLLHYAQRHLGREDARDVFSLDFIQVSLEKALEYRSAEETRFEQTQLEQRRENWVQDIFNRLSFLIRLCTDEVEFTSRLCDLSSVVLLVVLRRTHLDCA